MGGRLIDTFIFVHIKIFENNIGDMQENVACVQKMRGVCGQNGVKILQK